MLKKILSLVFNFKKEYQYSIKLKKYIEAKKCDDFIFENRDFDDD